jgi:hypothetical protein
MGNFEYTLHDPPAIKDMEKLITATLSQLLVLLIG